MGCGCGASWRACSNKLIDRCNLERFCSTASERPWVQRCVECTRNIGGAPCFATSACVACLNAVTGPRTVGYRLGGRFGTWCTAAFPNLAISPDVTERDETLGARLMTAAVAKLARMDETARRWRSTGQCVYLFEWSPESESTRSNRKLMQSRVFRMPQGGTAVFERHVRISARHRIHFIEDHANRTFVIGHIGDHLPTTRYAH